MLISESILQTNQIWFHQGELNTDGKLDPPAAWHPFYMANAFHYGLETDGKSFIFKLVPNLKIFDTHDQNDIVEIGYARQVADIVKLCGNLYGIFGMDENDWYDSDDDVCDNSFVIGVPEFRRFTESCYENEQNIAEEFELLTPELKTQIQKQYLSKGMKLKDLLVGYSSILSHMKTYNQGFFYKKKYQNNSLYPSFGEYVMLSDIHDFGYDAVLGIEVTNELIVIDVSALESVCPIVLELGILKKMNKDIIKINAPRYNNMSYQEKLNTFMAEYKRVS